MTFALLLLVVSLVVSDEDTVVDLHGSVYLNHQDEYNHITVSFTKEYNLIT